MAITISGQNNNDKILASDGVLDSISGFNVVGVMTAAQFDVTGKTTTNHLNIGSNIQIGNAGIITATTLIGNVTGNINASSTLLLQTGGSERFRIASAGQLGIGGANYGSLGQVLTSGGSGGAATWSTISSDKITEGNTEAEVYDNGSDGRFTVKTEGSERLRVSADGNLTVGAAVTISPVGNINATGIITATSFSGSGANLTSLPAQATIANNADNRIITGGSGVNLNAESTFTYDGSATVTLANTNPQIRLTDTNDSNKNLDFVISGGDGFISANSSGMGLSFEVTGSTRLHIDSGGRLLIGHTSSQDVYATSILQIQGTTAATSSMSLLRHGNSPYLTLGSSGGSSLGAVNALSSGNRIGQITFAGADGTDINTHAASIAAYVNGSVSSNNVPAAITFQFGSSESEKLRISSDGLSVANSTNTSALCINNIRGSASAPSFNETNADGFLVDVYNTGNPYPRYISLAARGYGSTSAEMSFWTDPGTDPQKRMTISPTGNIGIKLDDPQEPLNVKGTISTGRNVAREVGTIIDVSSNYNGSRAATNVINGSKNYEDYNNNDWITANYNRTNANFTLDLGAQYNCDRFVIYNQNEYDNNVREVKRFTLEGSNDKSSWTTLLDDECGASYGHEPNPGFSFRIPSDFTDDTEGASYRYWRFTMKSFHGSTTLGGIMEIELYEHAVGEATDDETTSEVTSHAIMATDIYAQNIYHDLPAFYVARSSAQGSMSDQTWTKIAFTDDNSGAFDTNGYWNNSNYRYTPTIPGYYQFQMNQSISHGSVQASYIAIYKNGSSYCQTGRYFFNGDNYDDAVMSTSCLMHCDGQSDYVEFYAWRYGGSSSFGGSSALSQASGFLVRHAGYRRHGDGYTNN